MVIEAVTSPLRYADFVEIVVIIPSLCENDRVSDAIFSARGAGVEVVVVDGGSSDGTSATSARAGARVIKSPPGRSTQCDTGFRASVAPVVLFLHADTILPQNWQDSVKNSLRDPAVSGGAFSFSFDKKGVALACVEWGVKLRTALFRLPYGDQAIFARRSVLESAGGFPLAPIMEDLDLVRQVKLAGKFVLLSPKITTSSRRYLDRGVLKTSFRNFLALIAWWLELDRDRIAKWYST